MEEGATQIPIQETESTADTGGRGEGDDVTPEQRGVKRYPPNEDDSDDCGGYSPDPRGRNGDSSDDDYKEDPFDLCALSSYFVLARVPRSRCSSTHKTQFLYQ